MSLVTELTELAGRAFASTGLDAAYGDVVVSQRRELGQFQCNGALAAARSAGRNPREIAAEIAAYLVADHRVAAADVAGPGFVNITVSDPHLAHVVDVMARDPRLSVGPVEALTVVVDYAGPNVAKAMHVGHLRATIIGDSLSRVMRFLGHRVIRDPHFGDWGLQMGLLIAALYDERPDLPYFSGAPDPDPPPITLADLQRIYPAASARSKADPEFAERARIATVELQQGRADYLRLWKAMKSVSEHSQRIDFANLGVEFDLWYGESDVADRLQPLVDRLKARGVAIESEGALIVPVSEDDDNRSLPPLILATSLGGFLYSTTDLATLEMRVQDLGAQLILYVVDARQSDHFEQVFRAATRAGILPNTVTVEHIKFGTMNGKDGKPFKTRAGDVVALGDVIELMTAAAALRLEEAHLAQTYPPEERAAIARLVGIGALKYADLVNHRVSNYILDLDRFTSFDGKTGPYLQYGTVRAKSILREAGERGLETGTIAPPVTDAERDLMLELARLPEVVTRTASLRAPNHLAEYAFELAGSFNRFYDACHILSQSDPALQSGWLRLVDVTREGLTLVLDLLGIGVPERM